MFRRLLAPVVAVGVIAASAAAAYLTRESWLGYVFPAPSGKAGDHADDPQAHEEGDEDEAVTLTPQAQQNLGLEFGPVSPRPYARKLLIPGVVVDRPGESDRSVTARLSGVVTSITAKPGDSVTAGQTLFTLQLVSETVQAAQRELATASRELTIATADRDRVAKLVEERVSPAANLIEPENRVKRATTLVGGLRRQLQGLGLTGEQIDRAAGGEFVNEITVTTPAPGDDRVGVFEVQELKVRLGDTVQAGQPLCVLATHHRLYVEGWAFKSEATLLAELAERRVGVEVEFADERPGEWPVPPPLVIHHLSSVVDPATRTFAFYLPLENQARTPTAGGGKGHPVWRYLPGQRVRVRVPVAVERGGAPVIVLPAGAVVREGAEAYVFVRNGDQFVRLPVRVLHEDRTEFAVADDGSIPAGAVVVKNQATALNRALKAAHAEGGGHHHDHDH